MAFPLTKVPYFDRREEPQKGAIKMSRPLHKVTVYLTAEEYAVIKAEAEDEDVTVSAILRARLGLTYKRRGAPAGNTNRRARSPAARREKTGKTMRN